MFVVPVGAPAPEAGARTLSFVATYPEQLTRQVLQALEELPPMQPAELAVRLALGAEAVPGVTAVAAAALAQVWILV